MAVLSRNDILNADDRETKLVAVPEWGGEVYVRTMTGTERDEFEASSVKTRGRKREQNLENFRARLLVRVICDENGERLFDSKEDVDRLGKKSAAALDRVFEEAARLNGMSEKDVEELVEDFDEAHDESSTSD